jgi:hypothetical protein
VTEVYQQFIRNVALQLTNLTSSMIDEDIINIFQFETNISKVSFFLFSHRDFSFSFIELVSLDDR